MNTEPSQKKPIIILLVLFIIVGIIYASIAYFSSYKKLSVVVEGSPSSTSVSLKEASSTKETTLTKETTKIKKGYYIVTFEGNDYETQSVGIDIKDKDGVVNITPKYSQEKLSGLLSSESSAIQAAIQNTLPTVRSGFTVETGKLYRLGEWYGTKIHAIQTSQQEEFDYIDNYRIVLKKTNGTWKVMTLPPEILLSSKKYPSIPRDVLVDVNKNTE